MERGLNEVSVVIIGINVEKHLHDCIASVKDADYPAGLVEIVYVDGGSHDQSVEIARSFSGVKVVELNEMHPTPGRGRNVGLVVASHGVIQFLDADTVLHPAWLKTALPRLEGSVGAVTGRLRERYPHRNAYHAVADLEWSISAGVLGGQPFEGQARVFGGIVLARKDAVMEAGRYDGGIVAGEDPDLSYRMRMKGWTILRVDADMVTHDLAMSSLRQYLKRAYRSGNAIAQIGLRYSRDKERFYLDRLVRIVLGALAPPAVAALGLIWGRPAAGLSIALAIAFRSFRRLRSFMGPEGSIVRGALYCCHLSFVVYPQLAGVLRYLSGRVAGMPLQNNGRIRPLSVD